MDAQTALNAQMRDVESSYKRREVDIKHTEDEELQQYTVTVQSCGQALEFYQAWRARAVPHVAALREIANKLDDLQRALVKNMAHPAILAK